MNDHDRLTNYFQYGAWILIAVTVNYLFDIIAKKTTNPIKIFIGTFIPAWILASILFIVQDFVMKNGINMIDHYFAFSLPISFIVSAITFSIKMRKFKKRFKAQ
jgi:hypothetical protein